MRFNQIMIVDSIPVGERNTARQLYEDVSLRAALFAPAPAVVFRRIENAHQFLELLPELAAAAEAERIFPVLHIECHGNEDGLGFSDGSFATWAEMKESLIRLNVATEMNLLVVVAACVGSAITKTLGMTDRAPLHGLIGPTRNVMPDELMRSYLALYETLLNTKSARLAVNAMRDTTPDTFIYRSAEWVFQYVWDNYQKTWETPEARLERGRRMAGVLPEGFIRPEEIAQLLADMNPQFFERFRRKFFLCDLYPGHEARFTVQYEAP